MKRLLYLIAFLAAALIFMPTPTAAQSAADTVDVAALPVGNLNTVINSDTTAGGFRAHPNRVYRLKRGSVYQLTEPMVINGSITVIATDGTGRPPVLAPAILADNSSIDHFFDLIGKGSMVEINNLYFLSIRADQVQLGWSDGIRMDADSINLKLKGDIFEAFTDCAVRLHAQWSKMNVQDCYFRNQQHSTSYFGGQVFLSDAPNAADTCIFVNNTFFCNNSYIFSVRGFDNYAAFEHNTVVYGAVNPFLIRQAQNIHIDNNIFYSMQDWGGDPEQVIQGWFLNYPDTASTSIIRFRANDSTSAWSKLWGATISGPEAYVDSAHGVYAGMFDPAKRVISVQNNAYYWPQSFMNWVKTYNDSVKTADSVDMPDGSKKLLTRSFYLPTWMSAYTKYTIDSVFSKQSPLTTFANNDSVDPGFSSDIVAQQSKLTAYCQKIITNKLDSTWFYNPTGTLYPPTWPLPENFAYSNTALQHAGTDGFALGDLNWYPDQKSKWLVTDVKQSSAEVPSGFSLSNAYPNPFNPSTTIQFNLAKSEHVTLKVFNILGQEIKTLVTGEIKAGKYTATWNGTNEFGMQVPSGIYFYRLESQSFTSTKKMILMK